jgi:hypothetical protein
LSTVPSSHVDKSVFWYIIITKSNITNGGYNGQGLKKHSRRSAGVDNDQELTPMKKIISVAAISAVIITLFVPWFYASGADPTWTQTDQADFEAGVLSDVDTTSNPDNVELATGVGADLVIDGGTTTLGGDHYYDNVSIINGGILYVQSGEILRIYAKDIYIDASSSIVADLLGYPGGARNYTQGVANDGTSYDGTPGTGGGAGGYSTPNSDGPGGGGAGYGGDGGDGGGSWLGSGSVFPGAGGAAYGNDSDLSIYMGSGGGAGGASSYASGTYGGAGGQGGGAILLDAETIDIAGTVSASGGGGEAGFGISSGDGGGGGGGSGGTILINGETVTITGTLTASGGDGGPRGPEYTYGGAGGGGGGGRIKVFYESLSDGTASYSVAGGSNGGPSSQAPAAQDGQAGTTYKGAISYVSSLPYLSSGTLASQVLNTLTASSTWDELSWNEILPANTDITFEVRASNTPFAAGAGTPSWTDLSPADSPVTTGLPSGQYMQWRATLSTTDTSQTPVLQDVTITYTTGMPSGGSDSDTYYPDEDVTVSGTGFPLDTDIHVYVVDDGTWTGGESIGGDVGDGRDTIHTDPVDGSIAPTIIWTHPLTIGEYDIVFDVDRNGTFDVISDVVDDPGHPGFTVMATPPPPPRRTVGGEVFPVDKAALLLPWLGLGIVLILAAGGLILIRRQAR